MDYTNEELLEYARENMERGLTADAEEDRSVRFEVTLDALFETDLWPAFSGRPKDACLWRRFMLDPECDKATRADCRAQLTALLDGIGELIEHRKKNTTAVLCEVHEGAHILTRRCENPHLVTPPGREPQVGHPYRVTD